LTQDVWGIGCLGGGTRCGVAINSALLATIVGVLSTLLGLVFALVVQRGGRRYSGVLKLMSILPIVTPPFVIALALVVLFGRTGIVTGWLDAWFGIARSRWLYGLPGVTLAQLLSFSPIAFMILYGALTAISPALEEAAQTLRASRGRVFRTVTWPLLRPALANAFLLGFVESLADFGNPIVLAGNYEVLSTKIFFAVAGAQHDPGRAAALAAVLLGLTLLAFWLQQRWVGRLSYVTVTGKGDGGLPAKLPRKLWYSCFGIAATEPKTSLLSRSVCSERILIHVRERREPVGSLNPMWPFRPRPSSWRSIPPAAVMRSSYERNSACRSFAVPFGTCVRCTSILICRKRFSCMKNRYDCGCSADNPTYSSRLNVVMRLKSRPSSRWRRISSW